MPKLFLKVVGLAAGALLLTIATGVIVKREAMRPIGVPDRSSLSHLSSSVIWLTELPSNLYHSLTSPFTFQFILQDQFPGHTGFVGEVNQKERYLLLSRFDGDTGKPIAELLDLRTFEVLHTWSPDILAFAKEWNLRVESDDTSEPIDASSDLLYHPMMVSNGLVFVSNFGTLKKVNSCSNLVWQVMPAPNETFHHSVEVDLDSNVWSLSDNPHRVHPAVEAGIVGKAYRDQSIVKVSPEGEVLFAKSISDILSENGLGYLLWGTHHAVYDVDWVHSNEVQPAYSDTMYWKKGDVLISIHSPSLVLLYRPSNNKLIWQSLGYVSAQHDPNFVDDSRISIFDNNTPYGSRPTPTVDQTVVDETVWNTEHSQVIVYDFATQQYSSYLDASLRELNVQGYNQSRSDILPNGDLYIEETPNGRTLYFNADGSLRWSHVNRANDGNVYAIGWSRILYRDHEIALVRDFLKNKDERLAACKVSKPRNGVGTASLSHSRPSQ